jgi:hypothetical protein
VLCAVCCVLCAVCCVLCAVCCLLLYRVCCVLRVCWVCGSLCVGCVRQPQGNRMRSNKAPLSCLDSCPCCIAQPTRLHQDLNLEMFEGQLASGGGIGIAAGSGAAALPPPMVHAHKATAQVSVCWAGGRAELSDV